MTARVALAVAVAACGASEPVRSPARPLANASPPPPAPACVDPVADARARLGAAPAQEIEPLTDPPDLDGDGRPDVILRSRGGFESTHLLYAGSCARFVGRIEAFMLGCDGHVAHGMCDLWVDTWLMHGDCLRSRWIFDGNAYQRIGDGELVPGPRKGP